MSRWNGAGLDMRVKHQPWAWVVGIALGVMVAASGARANLMQVDRLQHSVIERWDGLGAVDTSQNPSSGYLGSILVTVSSESPGINVDPGPPSFASGSSSIEENKFTLGFPPSAYFGSGTQRSTYEKVFGVRAQVQASSDRPYPVDIVVTTSDQELSFAIPVSLEEQASYFAVESSTAITSITFSALTGQPLVSLDPDLFLGDLQLELSSPFAVPEPSNSLAWLVGTMMSVFLIRVLPECLGGRARGETIWQTPRRNFFSTIW